MIGYWMYLSHKIVVRWLHHKS